MRTCSTSSSEAIGVPARVEASAEEGASRGLAVLPSSFCRKPGLGAPPVSSSPESHAAHLSSLPKARTWKAPLASSRFQLQKSLASSGDQARSSGSASEEGTIIALR